LPSHLTHKTSQTRSTQPPPLSSPADSASTFHPASHTVAALDLSHPLTTQLILPANQSTYTTSLLSPYLAFYTQELPLRFPHPFPLQAFQCYLYTRSRLRFRFPLPLRLELKITLYPRWSRLGGLELTSAYLVTGTPAGGRAEWAGLSWLHVARTAAVRVGVLMNAWWGLRESVIRRLIDSWTID
jgi:hypothetical protein